MPEKQEDDVVVKALKEKYFKLAMEERYPHTEKITKELDNLEDAIKKLLAPNEQKDTKD